MKLHLNSILLSASVAACLPASANLVAHFPMDVRGGQIVESVSGNRFAVQGHFAPENVPGAVGQALRFDGYTSFIDARINNIFPAGTKNMTVSIWTAIESYPIVKIDENTSEKTAIVSCIDEAAKTGFGFFIGFDGKYSFKTFIGGWPVEVVVSEPMPTYEWNNLVAVIDSGSRTLKLYNNGREVGSTRCNGDVSVKAAQFKMGHGDLENFSGPFLLTSFNGLIDDIKIWDTAISLSEIQSWTPENPANLDIPASRFADDILRPRFHGMPAAAWTNECHGMWYADGRYHLFFQKNADGPYMARLHWGHISSENLYDWHEEKIAIAPGEPYDIKGCWSGCVFADDVITGGKPNILYTAVDYARATIAQAMPDDNGLVNWTKSSANPIINGRPDGLSDDFRDPYFFRSGNNAYIIVGSSKNGVGTTTLHRYDPSTSSWANDGLFFTGSNTGSCGTFWEMPNITPMPDGKWLFTVTPLGTVQGVRTLYWTGSIGMDGRFSPDRNSSAPKTVELTSREGFGLLSPTIYNHDGKTIALGIVPDKLPSQDNWNLGWAHCYSLPREWSIADNGELVQKPYSGLTGMRSATKFERQSFELAGSMSLAPVEGRAAELLGVFTVGSDPFGFKIFKNSTSEGSITYNPATGELTADFSRLARLVNDGGVYDGIYRCSLPQAPRAGSEMKINVFIDHSIVDIFINDRWATSIRVFPTAADVTGIHAFASGKVQVKELRAWTLSKDSGAGVGDIIVDAAPESSVVNVYNLHGQCVRSGVERSMAFEGLDRGIYVVDGKKHIVRE